MTELAGGDTLPAGSVIYTGIPPSTAQNAGDELDWRANHEGDVVIIATLADLDKYMPAVATVRTPVPGFYELANKLPIDIGGDSIVVPSTGGVLIRGQDQLLTMLTGSPAGPLISGPANLQDISISNTNAAGSDLLITSPLFANVTMRRVTSAGVNAGEMSNVLGGGFIDGFAMVGSTTGLRVTGTIGSVEFVRCGMFFTAAPGAIGFEVDALATIAGSLGFTDCEFIFLDPSQIGISFDTAAVAVPTLPTTDLRLVVTGCVNQTVGSLLDETPGHIGPRDIRMWSSGNTGASPSAIRGDSEFEDLVNPVFVVYGAPNTWTVVPHIGLGSGLAALAAQERVSLVRATTGGPVDPLFPDDWGLRIDGTSSGDTVSLSWQATVEGSGAAQDIQGVIEVDTVGDGLTWVATDTLGTHQQQTRRIGMTGIGVILDAQPGWHFRLAMRNIAGTNTTEVPTFKIIHGSDV